MQRCFWILVMVVAVLSAGCSRTQSHYLDIIGQADKLIQSDVDSALSLLDQIDPSELTADSLRAHYHYLKGWGHMRQNRSLIGDSLIAFAHHYYRGKDILRDVRSSTTLAWYKFWVGDTSDAIAKLDSIVSRSDVPDSLLVQTLRIRVLLGASDYQGEVLIPLVKRLVGLETDSLRKIEAKYILVSSYEYAEKTDSAIMLLDELVDYARRHSLGEQQFYFETERAQLLTESGRNTESDELIEEIFRKSSPDNGAADYLHMQHAINALNTGDIARAIREHALADSFAVKLRDERDTYYRSYSNLIRAMIDFRRTGRVKMMNINKVTNRQSERFNRMQASQWESERGALQQQSRANALKAESEHKTVVILIISIAAMVVIAIGLWIIIVRRQRERENEERIEALQKMVDEYKSAPEPKSPEPADMPALRRAMLQQLGIIKMVAETPTEQNREMLRKISSIDGETNGELVNWDNVFELIDSLYSGFYRKLNQKFGDTLSQKEKQIIVLMAAGFSTKEISVITGQTTSTIYVRKTSVRKKLGMPEKEDIVTFLKDYFQRTGPERDVVRPW